MCDEQEEDVALESRRDTRIKTKRDMNVCRSKRDHERGQSDTQLANRSRHCKAQYLQERTVSRTLISVDFKNKPRCDSLENSAKHCQHEKSRDHAAEKRERRVHPGHVDLGASESFESRTLLGFLHGRGNSSERRTRKSTLRPGRQAACKRLQHDEPRRKHPHCERGRRGAGKRDGVRARGKRRDGTTAQPRSGSGSEVSSQHQNSNYCTLFLSQPLPNSTNSEKKKGHSGMPLIPSIFKFTLPSVFTNSVFLQAPFHLPLVHFSVTATSSYPPSSSFWITSKIFVSFLK